MASGEFLPGRGKRNGTWNLGKGPVSREWSRVPRGALEGLAGTQHPPGLRFHPLGTGQIAPTLRAGLGCDAALRARSEHAEREPLSLQAVVCSVYIPFYCGMIPAEFRGEVSGHSPAPRPGRLRLLLVKGCGWVEDMRAP